MKKKIIAILITLVITVAPTLVIPEDINVTATSPGSDEEPYIYWGAPEHSFGVQSATFVNWTYFWHFFNEHSSWVLEGYNVSTEELKSPKS